MHPKKHLKKFGGVLFFGGRPPKIPTFRGCAPERLERGPQSSAHRRNFQKTQCSFVVLRCGYNPSMFHHVSSQHPRCPTQKNKKSAVFCPFRHRFQPNGWVTAVFNVRCGETRESSSPIVELKTYVSLFEKNAYGLRNRGVSAGVLGQR